VTDIPVCGQLYIVSDLSEYELTLISLSASLTWTRQHSPLCHTGSKCFDFSLKNITQNVQISDAFKNCPLRDVNECNKSLNCPWRAFSFCGSGKLSIDVLIEFIVRLPLFLQASERPDAHAVLDLA
jgi:hypothetical protein